MKPYILTLLALLSFPCLQAQSLEGGTFSALGKEAATGNSEIQLTAICGQPFKASNKGDQLAYGFSEIVAATNEASEITGISLDKSTATIEAGKSLQLTATILPTDADNRAVNWKSSDPAIATVSDKGLITALSAGSTILTATTASGMFAAECTVVVENISTAVETIENENKVYPRWIENVLYVELLKAAPISVIHVSGRIQAQVSGQVGTNIIATDSYPSGIYLIRLENQTVKVIKK